MMLLLPQAVDYALGARAKLLSLVRHPDHLQIIRETDETVLRVLAEEVVRLQHRLRVTIGWTMTALAILAGAVVWMSQR